MHEHFVTDLKLLMAVLLFLNDDQIKKLMRPCNRFSFSKFEALNAIFNYRMISKCYKISNVNFIHLMSPRSCDQTRIGKVMIETLNIGWLRNLG